MKAKTGRLENTWNPKGLWWSVEVEPQHEKVIKNFVRASESARI